MLEALHNAAKSWIVRILFALLIVSFGAWGVGDVFRSVTTDSTAAEVGSAKISIQDLAKEFDREVGRLRLAGSWDRAAIERLAASRGVEVAVVYEDWFAAYGGLPGSWTKEDVVFGTFFNGGVRAFDVSNPFRPEEVAYFVPEAPRGSSVGACQINDVYVDERGIVYAVDRLIGGLYTLELTL